MQVAYWVGRHSGGPLGGVAAHLYAEFDGRDLDAAKLRIALQAVCRRHPMLVLRIDAEGRQHLDADAPPLPLDVEDLRGLPGDQPLAKRLADKRRAWTHRMLDLASGTAAAFGLSLLPGGACRLHIDIDMIAVDPNGFRTVMGDLAQFYLNPSAPPGPEAPSYFDWLDGLSADSDLGRRRERDRAWWQSRLRDVAAAPPLPLASTSRPEPHSDRLATWLTPAERRALETCARNHRVTPSSLLLGLFAAALGRSTGAASFRLNVPAFWREPVIPHVGQIVGDFANVLILSVDLASAETLAALCRQVGTRLMDLIAHGAYPGVNVMRDLSRLRGGLQTAPVVFTAGLGIAGGALFDPQVERAFGRMNWVVSQAPQVALDAQVAALDDGILVNFDVRLDALPETWVRRTFEAYVALLRDVAADPARLDGGPVPSVADMPEDGQARATESMLLALHRRLAPGLPVAGDRPIAASARSGIAAFLATYLPASAPSQEAIGADTTPRLLASLVHAQTAGASEEIARVFLESIDAP